VARLMVNVGFRRHALKRRSPFQITTGNESLVITMSTIHLCLALIFISAPASYHRHVIRTDEFTIPRVSQAVME
jgi:hypothetical protein